VNRQKRVAIFSSRMDLNNPLGLAVGETPQITFRFCAHCQATAGSLEDLKPDYCRRRDQPELAEGRHGQRPQFSPVWPLRAPALSTPAHPIPRHCSSLRLNETANPSGVLSVRMRV
jgi:hypothetical protein